MNRCAVGACLLGLLFVACKSETKEPAAPPKPATSPGPIEPVSPPARSPNESVTPAVPSGTPPRQLTQDPVAGDGVGTITGVIKWGAQDFPRKTIKVNGDPNCVTIRATMGPLLSEKLIAQQGVIENVFVYIKSGLPAGKTWPIPETPVLLDQKGCHYEPHVFGVMAGQDILIRNSDPTAHNIHAMPVDNTEFNKGQPKMGMTFTEVFSNPEIGLKIKCDVHPWMSAYCNVMAHPFYAVSDAAGKFTIPDVPAGTYIIGTWIEHSGLKPQVLEVTVTAGDTADIEFTFAPPKKDP